MRVPSIANTGEVLDNRFLITERIAEGGMSIVFKAKDLLNQDEPVAVKALRPLYASGIGSWSIFQQEEAIGLRLNHPYVLRFLPLGANSRRTYIVTEFVPGVTLAEYLSRSAPLPELEALSIASRICAALQHVHERGYVHYDLKPANVMLCPDGTIRLIDFGLSHAVQSRRFWLSGMAPALGTADYVSPEQIRRKKGCKSADVYGVGAVLYEMLTGQLPFPGDDPFQVASTRLLSDPVAPSQVKPAISRHAEDIVLRALQRNPTARYPSVAALKADLDHPEAVPVLNLRKQLRPITRRRKVLHILRHVAIVGLLPVLSQVVLFLWLWHHFAHAR